MSLIWILQTGEPTPSPKDERVRLFRSGLLSFYLSKNHEVIWWSSNFDHANKKFRGTENEYNASPKLKILFLKSLGYKKNVSLKRIFCQIFTAFQFFIESFKYPKPDIIVANYPTPELCLAAILYSKYVGCKCVIDVRDLWPDDISSLFHRKLKLIAKVLLIPYFLVKKFTFSYCSAVCGVTQGYLDWAQNSNPLNKVFHLSTERYHNFSPTVIKIDQCLNFVFSGMLGSSVLLENYIGLFERLNSIGIKFRVDICGSGDKFYYYKSLFYNQGNIVLHGFCDYKKLQNILSKAHIGLIPYFGSSSLNLNIPNKVGEYCNHGLVILNSLDGLTSSLVEEYKIGINFLENNVTEIKKASSYITSLIDNQIAFGKIVRNSRNVFEKKFNSEKVYKKYCDWLVRLIDLG